MRLSIYNILLCTLFAQEKILKTESQGTCSNTCPPINAGKEIKAVCPGDNLSNSALVDLSKSYEICHPKASVGNIKLEDLRDNKGHVTIIANYYVGCEAGLRESGVFAHVAQRYYDTYGPNKITFIQSVKGGGTCEQWADIYENDASLLYPNSSIIIKDMPLTINDVNYEIRDDLFTEPFKHPSYIILDDDLNVRYKFIGPCCGYSTFFSCNSITVLSLDTMLTNYIDGILDESNSTIETSNNNGNAADLFDDIKSNIMNGINQEQEEDKDDNNNKCIIGNWSDWSPCSVTCGASILNKQFRYRNIQGYSNNTDCKQLHTPIETKSCEITRDLCIENDDDGCVKEIGSKYVIEEVAAGFNKPKDIKFHPTPGLHLSNYSSGRIFHTAKEEAWVVNSGNHSISIISAINTPHQTTISRRDRGYYHYMINGTAISFNTIHNSNRSIDRDSYNYWSICNNNNNTYMDKKEANYFMGPTLYNSSPKNHNLVNKYGNICNDNEECYFLHSDMLHESPACIGIVHDPEIITAYGNVYWVFDTVGNRQNGQLVRFDFQQPHGPGSMDHSVAAVRRYTEVTLNSDNSKNVHAGMAIHPTKRQLYISNPGDNNIKVVKIDSGKFSRFARQEYPIYSNRLPSFEYSIWECVDQSIFANNIKTPSGLALSDTNLFVAEHETGIIKIYEIESGVLIKEIETGYTSIGGLTFSPIENILYFVDENTNTVYRVQPLEACNNPIPSRINPEFIKYMNEASDTMNDDYFSLTYNYTCISNPIIPDSSYFEQVHDDTGYADADPNVQSSQTAMDESAALLVNRTDCEYDGELNYDALLLGGFYCHVCLPDQDRTCDLGGVCTNVQWKGYTCDNEYKIRLLKGIDNNVVLSTIDGNIVDWNNMKLKHHVTYRFIVDGNDEICLKAITTTNSKEEEASNTHNTCATNRPLLQHITDNISKLVFSTKDEMLFELITDDSNATSSTSSTEDNNENISININGDYDYKKTEKDNFDKIDIVVKSNTTQNNNVNTSNTNGTKLLLEEDKDFIDTLADKASVITKTISETYSSSDLSHGATFGIIVGIIVFVILLPISYYMVPMICSFMNKNKKNNKRTTKTKSSSLRSGNNDRATIKKPNIKSTTIQEEKKDEGLSLSVKLDEYC